MENIVCVLIVLGFVLTIALAVSWYMVKILVDETISRVSVDVSRLIESHKSSAQLEHEVHALKNQLDSLRSALALKSTFVK